MPLHSSLLSLKIIGGRLRLIGRRATFRQPIAKILEFAPVFSPQRFHERDLSLHNGALELRSLGRVRAVQCAVQDNYVFLSFGSPARTIFISLRSGNGAYVA